MSIFSSIKHLDAYGRLAGSFYQLNLKCVKKLLEIEKEILREVFRGDKHNLRKSANCKSQISTV